MCRCRLITSAKQSYHERTEALIRAANRHEFSLFSMDCNHLNAS